MWTKNLNLISFYASFIALGIMIFEAGFYKELLYKTNVIYFYDFSFILTGVNIILYNIRKKENFLKKISYLEIGVLLLILLYYIARIEYSFWESTTFSFFNKRIIYILIISCFLRDFSSLKIDFKKAVINPAQLFILSFFGIILIGAGFLMMPNATVKGILPLDALFTATSAVCVTGLTVLDTSKEFTTFGKIIILTLIQVGGLGIMTFASYFSYFFRGTGSYANQITLSEMTSSDKLGDVFNTLKRIIIITLTIEFFGAVIIYSTLDLGLLNNSVNQGIFFSVFHSISSFCNAGFSTLSGNLYERGYQFNYSLHLIIAALFIFGGLGFPIVYNVYKYFRHLFIKNILIYFKKEQKQHIPWVVNLNSRIILATTLILLIGGTALIYILEKDGVLKGHSTFGAIVEAFFISASNRTAGFNTVDLTSIGAPALLICIFLMWVGASPASTGGGVKTSTLAIATLNILSLARGKKRTEIFRREISDNSIRRAFAIIALSLIIIGFCIFLLVIVEKDKDILALAFEAFSAYSTVGLSINITPYLSDYGKVIIIALMFIGRVSMFSLLIAVMKSEKYFNYRYPKEEILIN
ncbi:TrkH family potassium uptake protein [Frigoriflavimonas asaccharolytica]|uniref:Potassium uptake TrkH family protein n=1 Tax=Frigoriflavimonas asaccharolytica TaxID=2735899 RepID=A0A8J8G4A2_9FLAO|nr:potassium transporter TrkG [Frigoriflavimonas asaccharolytica]NRS90999.1 potassium uptake TrkH family protein [Frigoriflavimonas asaccharolytica]